MTVVGLPTAASTSLQALLHDHHVTSWKIAGNGDNLTFVVRLAPATTDGDPATRYAHSDTHDNKVQCYRRKPPSQMRRDKKRAEDRKAKREDKASETFNVPLFEATPKKQLSNCHTKEDHTPDTDLDTVTAGKSRANSSDSTVLASGDPFSVYSTTLHAEEHGLETAEHMTTESVPGENCIDPEKDDPFDTVKEYTGAIMDRPLQRRLRDRRRNNTHHRIVTNDSTTEPLYIFETDDLVLVSNPQIEYSDEVTFWFIKQGSKNMIPEELGYMQRLASWRPVDRWNIPQHHLRKVQARQKILIDLIRFYLG